MKAPLQATLLVLSTLVLAPPPAQAENLQHLQQLLASKDCVKCNLSGAGLVFSKLSGANLSKADLTGANLSRADLQGADLRGANLTGASLVGVNLTGAKLDGAILRMADLRGAYLAGASMTNVVLDEAFLQGVAGLPSHIGTADQFFRWATIDSQLKNYPQAIENYNQALMRQSDLPSAYLGRGMARYQTGDRTGAINDASQAEQLFKSKNDAQGVLVTQAFVKEISTPLTLPKSSGGLGIGILNLLGTFLKFAALI
jgi:uncharacterized protein YjbI with pentapeptide repeats